MDANDELFYRLNDPDPKVSAWGAELQLIGQIFGSDFVERWLEWKGFEDEPREWRAFRSGGAVAGGPQSADRGVSSGDKPHGHGPSPRDVRSRKSKKIVAADAHGRASQAFQAEGHR
jgi:hypothetical protein